MDLLGTLRALTRWWWLTLLLLLLSSGGVAFFYTALPWTYQGTASVLFLSSPIQTKEAGGNPYQQFADSLHISAEAVGRAVMDARTVESLRRHGFTSAYTLSPAPVYAEPALDVAVVGVNPRNIQSTLDALLAEIPRRLATMQSGMSERAKVRTQVIAVSREPRRVPKEKVRLLVMVVAVELLACVALPVVVDTVTDRRRTAR
ncbi:hypothetical protein GCM10029978_100110 [Actinoallomurus acanthiterrae]